ncbi:MULTISPECIES: hypothetical protein [unclassified Sphingomonas]|uniref:hypothetical protein n=1 Tax=unclassified Sphingomonas TaxID=196159 RepID=UPI0006F9E620|nr:MULTISPECIES: hypothetical protein [unclassified Sphingomonas]KQM62247.1 hypothetical protein ASE65_04370 [Sphingomonas sp. Leaf16]KQN13651.1 hypothetical protein ASE81_04440 [Sphingomonas sp. Leaf29]KQN23118.1 hypothetical protein ASE83_00970 [Sphingomonas sp. Leaf32]
MDETIAAPCCPICGNDRWHDRALPECTHCGLALTDLRFPAEAVRAAIRALLTGGTPATGIALAPHARRNAGWALGLVADGERWRPATAEPHAVTLGMIARAGESARIAGLLHDLAPHFEDRIVLLDGSDADAAALARAVPGARVHAHPLNGDFAAQRNRVQALADGWVLQLDSDETPDAALLGALGWLTAAADRDGLWALGLPRRNWVDGVQAALWPDIQYRLNRAHIRFAGTVHERPVVPFDRTSLALAGAIDHHLARARVIERSRVYEAMSTGAGRPGDEAALLRPFIAAP